jgi:hypothetical protein
MARLVGDTQRGTHRLPVESPTNITWVPLSMRRADAGVISLQIAMHDSMKR